MIFLLYLLSFCSQSVYNNSSVYMCFHNKKQYEKDRHTKVQQSLLCGISNLYGECPYFRHSPE